MGMIIITNSIIINIIIITISVTIIIITIIITVPVWSSSDIMIIIIIGWYSQKGTSFKSGLTLES